MPVHQFLHDHRLLDLGLRNYWGYNTFGFFAPHYQYAATQHAGGAVAEFKTMVRAFHEAGIEVILDVVYNHTAEGNHLGPTLNFRGIDNAAYYRLLDDDLQLYKDFTGTGNSLNVRHPHTLQLIMDSLRYWVLEMHVDGFRFDLASTLAREFYDVDRLSRVLRPGAAGSGGQPGQADRRTVGRRRGRLPGRQLPRLWTEWNGKYRDTVRDYWRGEPATLGEFASRLTGSSDLYEATGRRPRREHQLRHLPRRLHAGRPGVLQREAQRGQRRGQPRRREPQPVVELRRRGPDRRPGDPGAARTSRCATSWPP